MYWWPSSFVCVSKTITSAVICRKLESKTCINISPYSHQFYHAHDSLLPCNNSHPFHSLNSRYTASYPVNNYRVWLLFSLLKYTPRNIHKFVSLLHICPIYICHCLSYFYPSPRSTSTQIPRHCLMITAAGSWQFHPVATLSSAGRRIVISCVLGQTNDPRRPLFLQQTSPHLMSWRLPIIAPLDSPIPAQLQIAKGTKVYAKKNGIPGATISCGDCILWRQRWRAATRWQPRCAQVIISMIYPDSEPLLQ